MSVVVESETPAVDRRLGIDWCREHKQPVEICCASRVSHRWGGHNSLRKYTNLMIKGRTHPFHEAGGPFAGAAEGNEALEQAISASTVERISLADVIATQPVTPHHIGLMLRGDAPPPRTGNHALELEDRPTVIRAGNYYVIGDGHHRLAADWARGEGRVKARVLSGFTPIFNNGHDLMIRPT